MIDRHIPEEMIESVRYDSSLDSYRESNYFDAIAIYGFTIDDFKVGIIASTVTLQDGLRMVFEVIVFLSIHIKMDYEKV